MKEQAAIAEAAAAEAATAKQESLKEREQKSKELDKKQVNEAEQKASEKLDKTEARRVIAEKRSAPHCWASVCVRLPVPVLCTRLSSVSFSDARLFGCQ